MNCVGLFRWRDTNSQSADDASSPIPIARPRGALQSLLSVDYPKLRLKHMVLPGKKSRALQKLIRQQTQRDLLHQHGKTPSSKILLAGPPGSGKTMTAAAVAGEPHLPLFSVRLDALITRFMGDTAAKLRLIFDHVAATRGVFLFDEFDAIGAHRALDNDVGEVRRILNSFLQFMEEDNGTDSIVVAATNFPQMLDRALPRRFDEVFVYDMPDAKIIRQVVERNIGSFRPNKIEWSKLVPAAEALSHAEIARAVDEVTKDAILGGKQTVTTAQFVASLKERQEAKTRHSWECGSVANGAKLTQSAFES